MEETDGFFQEEQIQEQMEDGLTKTEWSDSVKMLNQEGYLRVLKGLAMQGELNRSNLRSVCWKLFLSILSEDKSKWLSDSETSRKLYHDLKNKHIIDPHNAEQSLDVAFNNPLSQEEDSPWNKFFKDNEIKKIIDQDVVRTFPEVEFFKGANVRDMMTSILFCYAKEHPEISYRQGMHELLAPVLFVMASEQREDIESDTTLSPELRVVMDPKYTEHDSFTIFSEIMEYVSPWYINEGSQEAMQSYAKIAAASKWSDPRSTTPFQKGDNFLTSALSKKVEKIQFVLLKKTDIELYEYLNELEILPQVYGIRWIRLLFGREFPLPSVLELWDAIFADSSAMSLVEYLCVAMLVLIRKKLMLCDSATAMLLLMQYPWNSTGHISSTWGINDLIQMAQHFRKPEEYELPARVNQLYFFSEHYKEPFLRAPPHNQSPRQVHHNAAQQLPSEKSPTVARNPRFRIKAPKILSRPGGATKQPRPQHVQPHSQSHTHSHSPASHQQHPSPNYNPSTPPVRTHQPHPQTVLQSQPKQQQQNRHRSGGIFGSPARSKKGGPFPQAPGRPEPMSVHHPPRQEVDGRGQELAINPLQSAATATDNVLKERVEMFETMCKYCGDKMESYLSILQDEIQDVELPTGPQERVLVKLAELKHIRDLLQGKLPFAGVEWVGDHDQTGDGNKDAPDGEKEIDDSNVLVPDHFKPDETFAAETDTTLSHTATSSDNKEAKISANSSDEDVTMVFGSNMNREELMRAVFKDDTSTEDGEGSSMAKNDTGQSSSSQENIVVDSRYNPDDWVDIPNDELI